MTSICEREGNPAASGEPAIDFHQREGGHCVPAMLSDEIAGLESVGFAEGTCPTGGVKNRGTRNFLDLCVPVGDFQRVGYTDN